MHSVMFSQFYLAAAPYLSFLDTKAAYNPPGVIVGPIANFLGAICNFLFNFVYNFFENGSLAVTIIFFTIVVRMLIFPLSLKQHKSMVGMRRIQPEMDKITKKYKNNKDPEAQRKMSVEMSELYKKHKASPFSGCLPLIVQMPILYCLFYVMREAYIYIDVLNNTYANLATMLMALPESLRLDILPSIAQRVFPVNTLVDTDVLTDMQALLAKCTEADWENIVQAVTAYSQSAGIELTNVLNSKENIENLVSINMVETSGIGFPGIIIPILAGGTTFLSTFIMNKVAASPNMNPTLRQQQKIMLIAMPIMMGVFAISTPAGVGWYWTIGNVVLIFQQLLLYKIIPFEKPGKEKEIVVK